SRAASLIIGSGNSTPINDQVPELRKAQFWPVAGSAATAAPVSWDKEAITWTFSSKPVCFATSGRNGPSTVPEATQSGRTLRGSRSALISRSGQVLAVGL